MIKLVAIDLDDTLLNDERKISPRNRAAILSAAARGVRVTLSTGRMYKSALPYAKELGLDIPLITYNGAMIKWSSSNEMLYFCPVDIVAADKIFTLFKKNNWYIQAYADDELYVKTKSAEARLYEEIAGITAIEAGETLYSLGKAPIKLLAVNEPAMMEKIMAAVKNAAGDAVHLTLSKPFYLEMLNAAVNKGAALAFLAGHFNLKQNEIMAIGDSMNDLEMIKYAGLGVAIGNAEEAVKAAADIITLTNEEDGVADAIEKYALNQA